MVSTLRQKNIFVISLRDYLLSFYGTKYHFTFGEGDYKAEKRNGAYCLILKDSNEPTDITGFALRKDLCRSQPSNEVQILKDVTEFARQQGIETETSEEQKLTIKIGSDKISVRPYIEGGYAGEISISFDYI